MAGRWTLLPYVQARVGPVLRFIHQTAKRPSFRAQRQVRYLSTTRTVPKELRWVGACSAINNRPDNEDSFSTHHFSPELSYFGCFDGHGGSFVSEYCSQNLHLFLEKFRADLPLEEALTLAFKKSHEEVVECHGGQAAQHCGSTATVAILDKAMMTVASVGDSRAVLFRAGDPLALTTDHNHTVKEERERVQEAGGYITDIGYVQGRLNMTRAIGDAALTQYGVLCEPQITKLQVVPEDCFMILATDGVFEVLDNQQACAIVNSCQEPEEAAQELVALAMQLGSLDNVTALVVRLQGWGKHPCSTGTFLQRPAYRYGGAGFRFRPLSLI